MNIMKHVEQSTPYLTKEINVPESKMILLRPLMDSREAKIVVDDSSRKITTFQISRIPNTFAKACKLGVEVR
ncbi:hypothetical protein HB779_22960 (plasmid) [Phyllobacterium sp. 628]|uniref:hypothetical protein n=1 Tax=Phyllobacterium sp. 628 TaxID=2718938 RepID=UPI0016627406|nr:hypothetical protein [Phyllobacterium sp. 628]QND54770.1 hypothetical protein HB779_22960 [Phyllobacterium sp. 628]